MERGKRSLGSTIKEEIRVTEEELKELGDLTLNTSKKDEIEWLYKKANLDVANRTAC